MCCERKCLWKWLTPTLFYWTFFILLTFTCVSWFPNLYFVFFTSFMCVCVSCAFSLLFVCWFVLTVVCLFVLLVLFFILISLFSLCVVSSLFFKERKKVWSWLGGEDREGKLWSEKRFYENIFWIKIKICKYRVPKPVTEISPSRMVVEFCITCRHVHKGIFLIT